MSVRISPSLVPTISPGSLFRRFTEDTSLNIRWLENPDPVFGPVYNRPVADVALRQLILAKAVDALNLRLAFMSRFPFLITPTMTSGSQKIEVLPNWIWDMHVSIPEKWELLRLAKIKRVSGINGSETSGSGSAPVYTGKLRLVFTAQTATNPSETALFEADYVINSVLTYQIAQVRAVQPSEESSAIDPAEAETVAGELIFRTQDLTDPLVESFLDFLAPPAGSEGSTGEYPIPAVYPLDDSPGATNDDDFAYGAISHGTGVVVASAYNSIPATDSDPMVWLNAFNYPFGLAAGRTSFTPLPITVPKALFNEFNIAVPAGDEPTGDVSGTTYPVWISSIERTGSGVLRFVFSTYNVTDSDASTTPVSFATLTLESTFLSGRIVAIDPLDDLQNRTGSDENLFQQAFGRGHVVLSSKWVAGNQEIADFFSAFDAIIDFPQSALFNKDQTRISAYALSRVPKYTPTLGQAQALQGSTARRATPVVPSDDNRYVTEQDQGLGDRIDFSTSTELPPDRRNNPDIERYGYTGGLLHRLVVLIVDESGQSHDYENDILPRLVCLLGRNPQQGDGWYDGTRVKWFVVTADGSGVWVG